MVHPRALHFSPRNFLPLALVSLAVFGVAGCSLRQTATPSAPDAGSGVGTLHGKIFGGQQPVSGASIQLYAVGISDDYGVGATPLITGALPVSDDSGNFSISGTYTVPTAPSHFYIVASGGSPSAGGPVNPNLLLMSALGGCAPTIGLSPSLYINVNELTTMASVLALQPFMAAPDPSNANAPMIGAPSFAVNDLNNAFETVNNLVDTASGKAVLASANWATTTDNTLRLNTLGNILAACVNSDPSVSSSCTNLFTNSVVAGALFTPVDTVQAAFSIAQNPANNVTALFNLVAPQAPFVGLNLPPTDYSVSVATAASACPAPLDLATAANFAVLAASTVTNAGATVVTGGDIGLSPGTSVTGFLPGILTAPATMELANSAAAQAQADLLSAYNTAASIPGGALLPPDLSGLTLTPGLYTTTTTGLILTTLTLDAQNDPDAIFIFQIGTGLTIGANSQVVLINGAQSKNVFWQAGTATTLAGGADFSGTVMAGSTVTLAAGVTLHGRALVTVGAVTLDTNAVTAP
jgi:hypothetical protein